MAQAGIWPEWVRLGQSPPLPRAPGERGVAVIQQWEGPRPLGRVRRLGEGELASAPGERQDQQRRRRSRGPQKQDVVSSFRTQRLRAPGLRGRSGAGPGRGAPLAPSSRWGAQLLGTEGPHPALNPAGALGTGGWADSWAPSGASALRSCAWSSDLRKYSSSNTNFLSAYHVEGCVLGAVEENRDVNERLLVSKRLSRERGRTTLRINCSTFLSLHFIFGDIE